MWNLKENKPFHNRIIICLFSVVHSHSKNIHRTRARVQLLHIFLHSHSDFFACIFILSAIQLQIQLEFSCLLCIIFEFGSLRNVLVFAMFNVNLFFLQ